MASGLVVHGCATSTAQWTATPLTATAVSRPRLRRPGDAVATLLADLVRPAATVIVDGALPTARIQTLSRLVGPRGEVHVIEPDPVLAALLGRSLGEADAAPVRVVAGLLGGVSGRLDVPVASTYRIRLGSRYAVASTGRTWLRVDGRTLDDYLGATGLRPSLVVTAHEERIADLLAGARTTLGGPGLAWLVVAPVGGEVLEVMRASGSTLFDPATYRPIEEAAPEAPSGCLAVPRGPLRTVSGRWRRPPRLTAFHAAPLLPQGGPDGGGLTSDYVFLPAGRWLLTIRLDATGRGRLRTEVIDSEGRCLSAARAVDACGRAPVTDVHALYRAAADGVRIVARARGPRVELIGGSVAIQEVRFA